MPQQYSIFNPNLGLPYQDPYDPNAYSNGAEPSLINMFQAQYGNDPYAMGGMITPKGGPGGDTGQLFAGLTNGAGTDLSGAAGIAGGLGSLGKTAADLYFDVENRKLQKEAFAQNEASLIANYNAGQINSTAQLGLTAAEADRQRARLTGEMAGRGISSSSIANENRGYLDLRINNDIAAQQRQIALNTTNFHTQMALLELQKEKAKNDFMSSMIGGGISSAAGIAAIALLAFSDPAMKTDVKKVDKESALENINEIPVSSWKYKADPVNKHLGPMADDVKDVIGGDGHTIDLVSMNGQMMAAIQALTHKVDALEKRKNA